MTAQRANGDYQTPMTLARQVCSYLYEVVGLRPQAVLEPTCGVGHLLEASLILGARHYLGIELNEEYVRAARERLGADARVQLVVGDILATATQPLLGSAGPLLILGNPPWVNRATRGALGAPQCATQRAKALGLSGMEAMTGTSNFDLSLPIMLKLVEEYRATDAVLAMLCKTATARALLGALQRRNLSWSHCALLEFDAKKHFGVSVAAGLLVLKLGAGAACCDLYHLDRPTELLGQLTMVDGVVQPQAQNTLSSCCAYLGPGRWRSGLKHDCAKVMELTAAGTDHWRNGLGEVVALESDYVFPLVKSSHLKSPLITTFRKQVVVPQRRLREDTAQLQSTAPLLWRYLDGHRALLDARKSAIYRGAPDFSLFGIGDYSFARYKVALSGFYYEPLCALLYDPAGRPVMLDDTCYFVPVPSFDLGYALMLLLNSAPVQDLLRSLTFADAKRPYTQKLLARLDLAQLAARVPLSALTACEQRWDLAPYLTPAHLTVLQAWLAA